MVTKTIELTHGYTDPSGTVHKTVVMRPLKTKDIIDLQRSPDLQQLAEKPYNLGSKNPATIMLAASAGVSVSTLLLSRIVIQVGSLTGDAINPELFSGLYQVDLVALMAEYRTLNGIKESDDVLDPLLSAL